MVLHVVTFEGCRCWEAHSKVGCDAEPCIVLWCLEGEGVRELVAGEAKSVVRSPTDLGSQLVDEHSNIRKINNAKMVNHDDGVSHSLHRVRDEQKDCP